jgi:hypothetical protein
MEEELKIINGKLNYLKNKIKDLEYFILLNESYKLKIDADKIKSSCKRYDKSISNLKEYFKESNV